MTMHVRWLKLVLVLLISISISIPIPRAQANIPSNIHIAGRVPPEVFEQFAIEFQDAKTSETRMRVDVQTIEVAADNAISELEQVIDTTEEKILVSSDETALLKAAAKKGARIALMPFGKAIKASADVVGGVNSALRVMKDNVKYAAQNDKMRLALVTFATATDVYRWVHVDNLGTFAVTAAITYIVVSNALLSLNDNFRQKVMRPVERLWNKVLKTGELKDGKRPTRKQALSDFLSNLSLASVLNVGFIATISIDQIVARTFNPHMLSVPLLLGVITTAASFTWHEFKNQINEVTHPRAKKAAQVILNVRSASIAWLASSALLLNYSQHGLAPWLVITGAGILGAPLYLNARKLADWYENNKAVKAAARTFEKLRNLVSPRPQCLSVF